MTDVTKAKKRHREMKTIDMSTRLEQQLISENKQTNFTYSCCGRLHQQILHKPYLHYSPYQTCLTAWYLHTSRTLSIYISPKLKGIDQEPIRFA